MKLLIFIVLTFSSFSFADRRHYRHSHQQSNHHHGHSHHQSNHYHNGVACNYPVRTCPIVIANPGIQIFFGFSIYRQAHFIACRNQYQLCLNQAYYFTWNPYHAEYMCRVQLNRCLGYYY